MKGIFLDLECTGLDFYKHTVLELAFKVLDLQSGECLAEYSQLIKPTKVQWENADSKSLQVNGLKDYQSFVGAKDIEQVGGEVIEVLEGVGTKRSEAVFICQNPSFDRPFFAHVVDVYTQERLHWPYHWLDLASMHWAIGIQNNTGIHLKNLSKDAIAKAYDLPKESSPHRAMQGVEHLIMCYEQIMGWIYAKA